MSTFKFNFDTDDEKAPELTTKKQKFLRQIEMKIRGVQAQAASDRCDLVTPEIAEREVARLEVAYKDVKKGMSKDELAEYKAVMKANQPKTLTKEEQAAVVKEMDKNKDRPSH